MALGSAASAETYVVRPDGSGDFPTIQEAINASTDGDVVELADGTFRGPGNRDLDYHGKGINVRSQSGEPSSCVIDCQGAPDHTHRGFRFHSSEGPLSILEGVTITNGYADLDDGGALVLSGASPGVVNCVFLGNRAVSGGAVYANHGAPRFVECAFAQNYASRGAAAELDYVDASFDACTFSMNEANSGGGIFCLGSARK
jgi:predicted outer membrane repeat protein